MSLELHAASPSAALPWRRGPVASGSAVLLLAGAGAVHLAVVPDHLREFAPFGVFFVVVGLAQLGLAAAVPVRPGRRLLTVSAALQALLVVLWLGSRTIGLPVGPEPWSPEPVGVADVVCVALEVASVLVLVGLALRGERPRRGHPVRTSVGVAAVVVAVGAATFVGVGTGLSGMPVAASANPPDAQPGGRSVAALVASPPGSRRVDAFTLTAQEAQIGGRRAFTYDGTVPGPLLRVTQGDRVRVTLVNRLPVATTLHWHGVRVPAAADGVAGVTQDAVAPGHAFTYEFDAADAGTF